jgi:hypothetical protein
MKKKQSETINKAAAMSTAQSAQKNYTLLYMLIIVITGIIAYSNSFDCSFHFDDTDNISNNKFIRNLDLSAIWNYSHYRFLPNLSFALNFHFHRLDIWGYHLINLLIHLINALLVFGLVRLISSTPMMKGHPMQKQAANISFFAALLFVAHPLATQSVTYIVQRMASMVTLFYLLALLFYIKGRISNGSTRIVYFIGTIISAFCALVSKENSYTLPLTIGLTELIFFRELNFRIIFKQKWFGLSLVLLIAFGIFVFLQFGSSINTRPPAFTNEFREITRVSYLLTQFTVIPKYIQLLLLPMNQNMDYDWPLYHSVLQWQVLLGLLFILGLLGWGFYQLNKNRLYAYGIFFFFMTLMVESSIVPIDDLIFEHRTYLPSVGIFLIASSFVFSLLIKKGVAIQYLIIMLTTSILTFFAHQRNEVWKNELSLSRDRLVKSPNKGRAHVTMSNALFSSIKDVNDKINNEPILEEARLHAMKANEIWPSRNHPKGLMGVYHYMKGNYDSAYYYQSQVVEDEKGNLEFRQNLIKTLNKLKKYDEAISQSMLLLKRDATNEVALFALAQAYTNQGKLNKGLSYFLELEKVNPGRKDVLNYISQIYKAMGKPEEARQYEMRMGEME